VPKKMIGYVGSPRSFSGFGFSAGCLTLGRRADLRQLAAACRRPARVRVLTPGLRPAVGFFTAGLNCWSRKSGSIAGFAAALIICGADFCPTLNRVLYTIRCPLGPRAARSKSTTGTVGWTIILTLAVVNYLGVNSEPASGGGHGRGQAGADRGDHRHRTGSGQGRWPTTVLRYRWPGRDGLLCALVGALWATTDRNNVSIGGLGVRNPKRNLHGR